MRKSLPADAGLLFMKVGVHDGEDFESILARKNKEYEKTGMIFWGYGGGTCHPINQVQPYAQSLKEAGKSFYLAMNKIQSRHSHTGLVAKQYSVDNSNWLAIPDGIQVTGSKYALVLGRLEPGDLDMDLSSFHIAFGKSRGKTAAKYISGHVDKACIENASDVVAKGPEKGIRHIDMVAKLKAPYSVFVR